MQTIKQIFFLKSQMRPSLFHFPGTHFKRKQQSEKQRRSSLGWGIPIMSFFRIGHHSADELEQCKHVSATPEGKSQVAPWLTEGLLSISTRELVLCLPLCLQDEMMREERPQKISLFPQAQMHSQTHRLLLCFSNSNWIKGIRSVSLVYTAPYKWAKLEEIADIVFFFSPATASRGSPGCGFHI